MKEDDERLLNIAKWRKLPDKTTRLGDTVEQIINRVSPKQKKYQALFCAWEKILPEELFSHTRIDNIAGGQLGVKVDSPAHLYELRLCSGQLVVQLNKMCPAARIKTIKLSIG